VPQVPKDNERKLRAVGEDYSPPASLYEPKTHSHVALGLALVCGLFLIACVVGGVLLLILL
jgi:hypothetical protein